MNKLIEILKIAEIHAVRINNARTQLSNLFPISATKVQTLSEHDFLLIELLTNRFAKLQDLIGTKLVNAFLEEKGETFENITMIDKINKLEKLGLLSDANIWLEMRTLRNHLTHEYPDHPEITAHLLNQLFTMVPQLLSLFENLKKGSNFSLITK